MTKYWKGVDLDGTLAFYEGWKVNEKIIGSPIPLMVKKVQEWIDNDERVKIMTARVSHSDESQNEFQRSLIEQWCEDHIGVKLEVTCKKDHDMIELWDDRAVAVRHNTACYMRFSKDGRVEAVVASS